MRRLILAIALSLLLGGVTLAGQATKIHTSGTLPANCVVGNVYLKTGASPGFYVCLATNTWTGPLGTGGGSGSLILLTTLTASSSASLDFTGISSTYDTYFFDVQGLVPDTNAVDAYVRFGTGGGPTWDTGSNYEYAFHGWSNLDTQQTFASSSQTLFYMGHAVNSTASKGGILGGLWVRNVNSTTAYKQIIGLVDDIDSSSNYVAARMAGRYLSTTAVTGVRFLFSSGNIASGSVLVYGLAK